MAPNNKLTCVNSKPQIQVLSPKIRLKIKCNVCKKPYLKELLKKHMRISHASVKIPKKKIRKERQG